MPETDMVSHIDGATSERPVGELVKELSQQAAKLALRGGSEVQQAAPPVPEHVVKRTVADERAQIAGGRVDRRVPVGRLTKRG
jgi:hypothetical protein